MSTLKVNAIRHTGASSDAIELSSDGSCTVMATNNLSNRNLIINGDMNIWQRGDCPHTIAYAYSADRWERNFTLGGTDYYHIEKKTESPPGFSSSLEVSYGTAQASMSTNNYSLLRQKIEAQNLQHLAYGTSSAKKMTLSFWVRSNKTGTYAVHLQQGDNSNKQVSFNYSISSADTWEKKTISIPADTSGVINNDNGEGLSVTWWLAAGTNMTSGTLRNTAWTTYAAADQAVGQNVNLLDSTSNTWYITGVQLEVDSTGSGVATDFEHRSYGDEYNRCLRYFWLIANGSESAAGSGGSGLAPICTGNAYTSSSVFGIVPFPTRMRLAPSIYKVTSTDYWDVVQNNNNYQADDVTINRSSTTSVSLYFSSNLSVTANYTCHVRTYNSSARLGVDAEL